MFRHNSSPRVSHMKISDGKLLSFLVVSDESSMYNALERAHMFFFYDIADCI